MTFIKVFTYIFQLLLICCICFNIYIADFFFAFIILLTFGVTLLSGWITSHTKIKISSEITIIRFVFLFSAMLLGEQFDFYELFFWWDMVLHTAAGVICGYLAFMFILILNNNEKVNLYLSPFFVALFSLSFSMMIAVFWELFEFSMDQILGTNMQKSGLVDTMFDLIVWTVGALFSSVSMYFFIIDRNKKPFFVKVISNFLMSNREVFIIDKSVIDGDSIEEES